MSIPFDPDVTVTAVEAPAEPEPCATCAGTGTFGFHPCPTCVLHRVPLAQRTITLPAHTVDIRNPQPPPLPGFPSPYRAQRQVQAMVIDAIKSRPDPVCEHDEFTMRDVEALCREIKAAVGQDACHLLVPKPSPWAAAARAAGLHVFSTTISDTEYDDGPDPAWLILWPEGWAEEVSKDGCFAVAPQGQPVA